MLPRILMRGCDLSGMDCLDLGSMEGLIPVLMKRGGAQTVLATDFNGWLIEKLDAVRYAYDAEFEFRSLGLMYDIHKKLGGRSFDFINCSGLLYHTWSPLQVLAGIRPILRRGGYMLVSTYVSFEDVYKRQGYGDPALENCGFTLLVDLEEIPEGSVLLSASTSDSVVIGRSMVRLVGESGSGRQFNESELRRIAEGQWYYSCLLYTSPVEGRRTMNSRFDRQHLHASACLKGEQP